MARSSSLSLSTWSFGTFEFFRHNLSQAVLVSSHFVCFLSFFLFGSFVLGYHMKVVCFLSFSFFLLSSFIKLSFFHSELYLWSSSAQYMVHSGFAS